MGTEARSTQESGQHGRSPTNIIIPCSPPAEYDFLVLVYGVSLWPVQGAHATLATMYARVSVDDHAATHTLHPQVRSLSKRETRPH